ncbi:MAG TPA: 5-formyltetrahydrofolate cyclo-ligase [Candidatus Nanoarchaeia archaeon]|nr:5-formyltetrahydrofolate cyclo-ligase [Candidatus Nanoarchaeia archaeon]
MRKLREELLKVRGSLSLEEVKIKSKEIIKNVLRFKPFTNSAKTLYYHPRGKEADLMELMNLSLKENKPIFLPKTYSADTSMKIHQIKDFNSELELGAYGIKEPKPIYPEFPRQKLNLIFIPGVAFDLAGNRLGMGRGYYDRFLKDISAIKAGIAYEFQIVDRLDAQRHDIPMDFIITEKRIIEIKNPNRSIRESADSLVAYQQQLRGI